MINTDQQNIETHNIHNMKLNWYALYTRPRFERKVESQLLERNIEAYVPVQSIIRQWSDRRKKVEEPLFRGYVFVHISQEDRVNSMRVDGVVKMVGFGGKPSIIPEDQIESIKLFLAGGLTLELYDYLETGDLVEVTQGPFVGTKGRLVEKRNQKRFVINIDAIRQSIAVEIDPVLLKKIE